MENGLWAFAKGRDQLLTVAVRLIQFRQSP